MVKRYCCEIKSIAKAELKWLALGGLDDTSDHMKKIK